MAEINLRNGGVALVDDADLPLLEGRSWRRDRKMGRHDYAYSGKQSAVAMHRLIAGANRGEVVDHINGNGLDNRRANLRVCTFAENLRNRRRHRNSRNKFKGVSRGSKNSWCARIRYAGARQTIGSWATEEEAAAMYDIAALVLFGEFACLNFPHVFPEVLSRR